jgi:uncharacterized membrane protein YphA (DoxX/SURF4 family)
MLYDIWQNGMGGVGLIYFITRIVVGAFFAISGYHKLFNKQRHAMLVTTLQDCGIPGIRYMQWFVPSIEFFGGLGIIFGFLTVLAAAGLVILLMVAVCTDGLKRIPEWHPLDSADYADCVLYLPEVLLTVLLICIIAVGAGPISVDYLLSHIGGIHVLA